MRPEYYKLHNRGNAEHHIVRILGNIWTVHPDPKFPNIQITGDNLDDIQMLDLVDGPSIIKNVTVIEGMLVTGITRNVLGHILISVKDYE
jgi:hypothetical protein